MILDCGHPEDAGMPATIIGNDGTSRTVQGWTWHWSLDGKRKLCKKCYEEQTLDCGHKIGPQSSCASTGYGVTPDDKKICYKCCADRDVADMIATGKATLYLACMTVAEAKRKHKGSRQCSGEVTNWAGSLRFKCYTQTGEHNLAGVRYDAWFDGPDGYQWHGVTYGNNTQICHCKRTKEKAR